MTAERQVGERLSEQARETARVLREVPGKVLNEEGEATVADLLDSLARQLAEAERALLGAPTPDYAAWHPEAYRKWFRGERSASLNRPDPPASPAEGSEDDHARAEHLREAREVEDHQEAKHAARGSE